MLRGARRNREAQPADERPGFPLFGRLPVEIQQQIFTEAICRPNIHTIKVGRYNPVDWEVTKMWRLSFSPLSKNVDKSGYRATENISSVNRVASNAVELALRYRLQRELPGQSCIARLPFRVGNKHIDNAEDLVALDFPIRKKGSKFNYFHIDHHMLRTANLDLDHFAQDFKYIHKVALKYSDRYPDCTSNSSNFRCLHLHQYMAGLPEGNHLHWKMCPYELCGLLSNLPHLREFYIILEPSRKKVDQEHVEVYIKNYFSLPPTSPLRRSLAAFHATDHSYIELHASLMRRPSAVSNATVPLEIQHHKDINDMLEETRTRHFLEDANPSYTDYDKARIANRYHRMTLAERQAVVFKVLVAVPDAMKVGWEGEEGNVIRELCKDL